MTVPVIHLPEGALDDVGATVENFCWLMSSATTQDDYWSPDAADEVLSVYHALLYEGEVRNGGHIQFLANCDNRPEMYQAALAGLRLVGADPYADILSEMLLWTQQNPDSVAEINWQKPETLNPPVLTRLDDLFYAAGDVRRISDFAHGWLSRSPKLQICPQKEFEDTVFKYQAANKS